METINSLQQKIELLHSSYNLLHSFYNEVATEWHAIFDPKFASDDIFTDDENASLYRLTELRKKVVTELKRLNKEISELLRKKWDLKDCKFRVVSEKHSTRDKKKTTP